jgi:hypothetical protein
VQDRVRVVLFSAAKLENYSFRSSVRDKVRLGPILWANLKMIAFGHQCGIRCDSGRSWGQT